MELAGPFTVEVKLFITDGTPRPKGEQPVALLSIPPIVGVPGDADIIEAIEEFIANRDGKGMPEGWRLMTKQEFWDYQCVAQAGTVVAMEDGPTFTRSWGGESKEDLAKKTNRGFRLAAVKEAVTQQIAEREQNGAKSPSEIILGATTGGQPRAK